MSAVSPPKPWEVATGGGKRVADHCERVQNTDVVARRIINTFPFRHYYDCLHSRQHKFDRCARPA